MLLLVIALEFGLIILCLWVFYLLTVAAFVPIERRARVPFVPTPRRKLLAISGALDLRPGEKLYDLGCGNAYPLIHLVRSASAQGRGYEISFWPYLWARLNAVLLNAPVEITRTDLYQADLKHADAVFCYLLPSVLGKLESKFAQELRPGTRVVSFAFALPVRKPDKVIETNERHPGAGKIYVYYY